MAMAVHESPDMTTLWPVRKRLRRDSSPPIPPRTTAPAAITTTAVTPRSTSAGVPFRVQNEWCQHAARPKSASPPAGVVNEIAGEDDRKRVRVVFSGVKARPKTRRRRLLSQITMSPAYPIQQYPCGRRTTGAGQKQVEAEEKVPALEPCIVAIEETEAPLWHKGQVTRAVDPLRIVRRLPPPLELPASPVNAGLEAELRLLFDQVVNSGELVFRFCTGSEPGSEHVECCDALTAWVFQLLSEGAGNKMWQDQIERLVYKVLFEYIMKQHFGDSCGNGGRIAGPVGEGELMNVHGKRPKQPLLDMLMWLKDVAVNPLEPRMSGMLQDQEWHKLNVNISSHRNLPPRGPNCLNVNECPGEDNIICWQQMVLCSREALFVKTKDTLSTEDFHYRSKKQQMIQQYLSGMSRPAVPISPDNIGSSSVELMPMHPRRSLMRSVGLLKHSDGHRKRVPIGPAFQADVPQWKDPFSRGLLSGEDEDLSDPKWLGTQIWPIDGEYQEASQETIGKGRVDSCVCPYPRTVSCVRYHVSLGRFKLRQNVGQAFGNLGFTDMGEEVSNSWTLDEERIFRALVKLNPLSEEKSFLEPALKLFGSKSRQKIVSYYFNIFVPRRMGIQTEFLGGDADSDDDEVNTDGYEDFYQSIARDYHLAFLSS